MKCNLGEPYLKNLHNKFLVPILSFSVVLKNEKIPLIRAGPFGENSTIRIFPPTLRNFDGIFIFIIFIFQFVRAGYTISRTFRVERGQSQVLQEFEKDTTSTSTHFDSPLEGNCYFS
jgi:hypothetical protein